MYSSLLSRNFQHGSRVRHSQMGSFLIKNHVKYGFRELFLNLVCILCYRYMIPYD
jgi:hypothetical protein